MRRITVFSLCTAFACLDGRGAAAQSPAADTLRRTMDAFFVAMRASDTATIRAAFLPGGRVIVMPGAGGAASQLTALTVDDFVTFAGKNAPQAWVERIWDFHASVNGSLGSLWFEYDVYRNNAFSHCGINSVQMQRTPDGWKAISMAFTSQQQGCPTHPPPTAP